MCDSKKQLSVWLGLDESLTNVFPILLKSSAREILRRHQQSHVQWCGKIGVRTLCLRCVCCKVQCCSAEPDTNSVAACLQPCTTTGAGHETAPPPPRTPHDHAGARCAVAAAVADAAADYTASRAHSGHTAFLNLAFIGLC